MVEIYCQGLDANVSTWGQCLLETAFFGEPIIMGIVTYAMFALAIWQFNLPGILALPLGVLISISMYLMNPAPIYFTLLVVALMVNFAYVAMVVMNWWSGLK